MLRTHAKYILLFLVLQMLSSMVAYMLYVQHTDRLLKHDQQEFENQVTTILGLHSDITEILQHALSTKPLLQMFAAAQHAEGAERDRIRREMYQFLQNIYGELHRDHYLEHLHFYLPSGEMFLQMHAPDEYGANPPGACRADVKTLKAHTAAMGYEKLAGSSGFCSMFSLFDPEGTYLGNMEVMYASEALLEDVVMASTYFEILEKYEFAQKPLRNGDAAGAQLRVNADYVLGAHSHQHTVQGDTQLQRMRHALFPGLLEQMRQARHIVTSMEYDRKFYTVVLMPVPNLSGDQAAAYFVAYIENQNMPWIRDMISPLYAIVTMVNLLIALFLWRTSSTHELMRVQKTIEYKKQVVTMAAEAVKSLAMTDDYTQVMERCLKSFITVLKIDRACIFANHRDVDAQLRFEAVSEGCNPLKGDTALEHMEYYADALRRWRETFEAGQTIEGDCTLFPKPERLILQRYGMRSIILMPITVEGEVWGFVCLASCGQLRIWEQIEKHALELISLTLSATISRQNQHMKLLELMETLESRVMASIVTNRRQERILFEQARSAQMGEMISMIAHQWRQPLNAISTAAIKLNLKRELNTLSDADISDVSFFIQNQTREMSQIINDFMYFFKPDSEKIRFTLDSVIDEIRKMIGSQLKSRGIVFEVHADDALEIYGHKKEFVHILLNLISNARDALTACGSDMKKVLLDARREGETIVLDVSDNGCGIDTSIITRVFDPYFTTKAQGQGTGIGLYMVREMIVNDFKGSIAAENLETGGARFTITLPLLGMADVEQERV